MSKIMHSFPVNWRSGSIKSDFRCDMYPGSIGFPTRRKKERGNYIASNNSTMWFKCPEKCRRQPEWTYCWAHVSFEEYILDFCVEVKIFSNVLGDGRSANSMYVHMDHSIPKYSFEIDVQTIQNWRKTSVNHVEQPELHQVLFLQKLRHCVMTGISLPESPKRLDSSALDGLRGIASLHVMVRSWCWSIKKK